MSEPVSNTEHLQWAEEEKTALRWGGLAGILGNIIFVLVFAIVFVFVLPESARTEELVRRFPDVRAAKMVENSLYLVVLLLYVTHVLALYRALRGTSLAPALFGSALSILGLGMLAAGTLSHFFQARISDLYHAPEATSTEQESLVLMWEMSQSIFDTLLFTGLFIVPIGYIALRVAVFGAPGFGKGFGGMSVALWVTGVVAAFAILFSAPSEIAVVGVFVLVIFHAVMGWKVYSLSRTTLGAERKGTGGRAESHPTR